MLLPLAVDAADHRRLFKRVDPSVVVLYTVEREVAPGTRAGQVASNGLGSGVLVDDQGHVMTAAHVVQTADLVQAEFVDGFKTTAVVVASDPSKDVALVKLDKLPDSIKPAKVGDSDDVEVGEEIIVIGAPYGLSHTLTTGHISARHRNDDALMSGVNAETFQTDAAINRGNSGGPVFNLKGEVIGIVSYIRSQSGGSDGLGFAVTSNAAYHALFEERMAWSGLSGVIVTGPLADALNVPQDAGYLVQKVAANSPAARVGLQAGLIPARIAGQDLLLGGDVILELEGMEVKPGMLGEFRSRMTDRRAPFITLKVLRGGEGITLRAPVSR